jgi:NAD(P)-dependent dehydrogenase (short-subunit alcohol dehydrogenase family)
MRLRGRAAIVTGGSSGIGRAVARRFMSEGASVIVFDLKKPDYEVEFRQVDVSDEAQVRAAIQPLGQLDVLVNCAGIYLNAPMESTTAEQLDRIFGVNFKGTFWVCKHALPLLRARKGNIVNIASVMGVVAGPGEPAYCSTKAAVIMLTKSIAQMYAREGVRANAVLPGPIVTPLLMNVLRSEKDVAKSAAKNPMGKLGTPEDVAGVVLFLASDEANFVTGAEYSVDGGESSSSVYSRRWEIKK